MQYSPDPLTPGSRGPVSRAMGCQLPCGVAGGSERLTGAPKGPVPFLVWARTQLAGSVPVRARMGGNRLMSLSPPSSQISEANPLWGLK